MSPFPLPSEDDPAMIKDIVVNLPISGRRNVADYALSVATTFDAHITGIAFTYDVVLPVTMMDGIPAELIETSRRESNEAAKAALETFNDAAVRAGLTAATRAPNASFDGVANEFGRVARCFDLAIVGQAEPDKLAPEDAIIEAALFGSGRPVIIVPYIQKDGLKLDHVMLCWDGSRAAARATADAMSFFGRAKNIDVVTVKNKPGSNENIADAEIAHHFARHGFAAQVRGIEAADLDVATAILSHAADASADLIVMGGYGHSRLREFVLGGVTRNILKSMTVPVLMSH
jgi:nucleotide-binding universal stress UspA family protein